MASHAAAHSPAPHHDAHGHADAHSEGKFHIFVQIAMLLADTPRARLAVGWVVGVLVSVVGMLASFHFDLPTGAAVVTTFGAALAVVLAWSGIRGQGQGRGRARA